jgi:hypothetical protein
LIAAVAAVVPTGLTVLTDRTVLIDPTAPTRAQAAAAAPTGRTALTGPIGLTASEVAREARTLLNAWQRETASPA